MSRNKDRNRDRRSKHKNRRSWSNPHERREKKKLADKNPLQEVENYYHAAIEKIESVLL